MTASLNLSPQGWDDRSRLLQLDDLPGFLAHLDLDPREQNPRTLRQAPARSALANLRTALNANVMDEAVAREAVAVTGWLLEIGCDPNRRPPINSLHGVNGETLLHVAASKGNAPLVDLLLRHGADPSLKTTPSMSTPMTPLELAITTWGTDGLQPLAHRLDQGVGATDVMAVLHRLIPVSPLDTSPIDGRAYLRRDPGTGQIVADDEAGKIATNTLARAVWANHGPSVHALLEYGMSPATADARPLWRYALDGNRGMALSVLMHHRLGPPPDWRDAQGNTPLHLAVTGHADAFPRWTPSAVTLTALIRRDSVLERNHAGHTPLDLLRAQAGDHALALSVLNAVEGNTLTAALNREEAMGGTVPLPRVVRRL